MLTVRSVNEHTFKMKRLLICLLVLLCIKAKAQESYTLSGYIKEKGSEESLIGANVLDVERRIGTAANSFGYFSMKLPANDSAYISVSFIGYQTMYFRVFMDGNRELNVLMEQNTDLLNEVELVEEVSFEREVQMSSIDVPIKQIKTLPAFMGEVDVMKVLQLLPGVQSGSEGTSGIYVRGGGPDQNLILLDGVPVYNASHLFGFFSVFNSDAVKNVQLDKGGFPARYGGRLSSVVNIDMKDGNRQEWGGSATIGLIASRLMLEGPVIKGKSSLMISARRTYLDVLIQPLIAASDPGASAGYYFGDLNLKYNHDIGSNDKVYLSFYGGRDEFYAKYSYSDPGFASGREEFGLGWGNITTALRWNHLFNPDLFGNLTATYSRYRFDIGIEEEYNAPGTSDDSFFGLQYISDIQDFGLKADLEYRGIPNHLMRYGGSYTRHSFRPGAFQFREETDQFTLDSTFNVSEPLQSNDSYLYFEDEIRLGPRLKINPGVHLSHYNINGENYWSFQPRFGGRYMLTDELSLKASYAHMRQYLHLLTNSNIGLPTDLWVSATDRVAPMSSHQVAAGVARMLNNGKYEFSVEAYYKWMNDLITFKNGATFIGLADWQDKVVTGGRGNSYGVELFLQKRKGNTTGWIGYTLSWSNRQFEGSDINYGNPYPYKYDRRHDLSFVLSHQFSENIEGGFTWVFGTGNAITLESASYSTSNQSFSGIDKYFYSDLRHYDSKNNFRMEAYHRMDLSISFHKKKKQGKRTWNFSVYNAYNRANPFFYTWRQSRTDPNEQNLFKVSIAPLIPGISWTRTF